MKYLLFIHSLAAVLISAPALAQDAENSASNWLEVIQIIGTRDEARNIAGSGALIDGNQIHIEAATDINQLMKTIPGTYVREEDGLGLRPNIGIRAASSERSGKVTLMEDGVMVAPAPYSNPAAYYFPTTMRMSSVEVLKGAPLLRYGPQTTGGVINLISTPIPETNSGNIMATIGEHGSQDLHANYGSRSGNFGWLVETVQRNSDGFKHIDRSNRDAGLDLEDYLVKLAWEGEHQQLLFKAQRSEEVSNETYLGLTDADFNQNPNRRYGLSSIDQMNNEHDGYSLTYNLMLDESTTLTAMAYHNEFSRDWFKLGGGSAIIDAANAGDSNAQAILDGSADTSGLGYKHSNRSYESSGVELNLTTAIGTHQLEVGGRIHEDEMDRFQPVETDASG
ncbi:MAG: TonB-dependent receptor family protein [Porticoccaceae bacterium]